jgi:hypothetical protein
MLEPVQPPSLLLGLATTIYMLYVRQFWQGYNQIYGQVRCIHTVLANPEHKLVNTFGELPAKSTVYTWYVCMYVCMHVCMHVCVAIALSQEALQHCCSVVISRKCCWQCVYSCTNNDDVRVPFFAGGLASLLLHGIHTQVLLAACIRVNLLTGVCMCYVCVNWCRRLCSLLLHGSAGPKAGGAMEKAVGAAALAFFR